MSEICLPHTNVHWYATSLGLHDKQEVPEIIYKKIKVL